MPSPGTSPWDRQHVDKQAFPWHPSTRGHADYTEDIKAFSWHPFQFGRRQAVSACSGSPPQCSTFSSYLGRERGLWSWLWHKLTPWEAVLVLDFTVCNQMPLRYNRSTNYFTSHLSYYSLVCQMWHKIVLWSVSIRATCHKNLVMNCSTRRYWSIAWVMTVEKTAQWSVKTRNILA